MIWVMLVLVDRFSVGLLVCGSCLGLVLLVNVGVLVWLVLKVLLFMVVWVLCSSCVSGVGLLFCFVMLVWLVSIML